MPQLTSLDELGIYVITVLVLAVGFLFRENQRLNREMVQTLKEVIPAIAALSSALTFVKGKGE